MKILPILQMLAGKKYTAKELAKDLGVAYRTAGKYLRLLYKSGVVARERAGREYLYYIPRRQLLFIVHDAEIDILKRKGYYHKILEGLEPARKCELARAIAGDSYELISTIRVGQSNFMEYMKLLLQIAAEIRDVQIITL